MSTDTTTTADTLGLSPDTLTLVVLSEEYARTWAAPQSLRDRDSSDDERTFYAIPNDRSPEYATLVVPTTDPRSRDMWVLSTRRLVGTPLEGDDEHRGWDVEVRHLSRGLTEAQALEATDPHRPPSADLDESQRRDLPIAEAYPIGSMWRHISYAEPVTIAGHRDTYVVITGAPGATASSEWPRGALDAYGTYVGRVATPVLADEASSGTFTQADVDRLVREAREAKDAELAQWKEYANGIAVQYAKDNELCGNFERCMSDIGLMGREEWDEAHKVTRYVTFRVEVEVPPDADVYATRYAAAERITEDYASTVVDWATEVQDDDGDTVWED